MLTGKAEAAEHFLDVQAISQVFLDTEEEKVIRHHSDIVEQRKVFIQQRLEKLRLAVAFDMSTVSTNCVSHPCVASMSAIVVTFVTQLIGLSAQPVHVNIACLGYMLTTIWGMLMLLNPGGLFTAARSTFDWCNNILFDFIQM